MGPGQRRTKMKRRIRRNLEGFRGAREGLGVPGAFGGGLRGSGWGGEVRKCFFFLGGEGEFESKIANVSEKNRKTYAKIGTHLNKTREQNEQKEKHRKHTHTGKNGPPSMTPGNTQMALFDHLAPNRIFSFFFLGLAPHAHSQRAGKFKM